eukprot:351159-Chlamydomonas_euryale.AAC.4
MAATGKRCGSFPQQVNDEVCEEGRQTGSEGHTDRNNRHDVALIGVVSGECRPAPSLSRAVNTRRGRQPMVPCTVSLQGSEHQER